MTELPDAETVWDAIRRGEVERAEALVLAEVRDRPGTNMIEVMNRVTSKWGIPRARVREAFSHVLYAGKIDVTHDRRVFPREPRDPTPEDGPEATGSMAS